MTLYEFINTVKSTALKSAYINAFGQGDVYENLNSGDKQYPFCNLTIDNVNTSSDYSTVNFNLFYIDRLLTDSSNKEQIQSFAITVLNLVLNKLENDQNVNVTSKTFYPFVEQFSDLCCGAYVTCSVTIPEELICDDSFTTNTLEITSNGQYSVVGYDNVDVNVHSDDVLNYFTLYSSNYIYANYFDPTTEIVSNVKFTGDEDFYFCSDEKGLVGLYFNAEENETYAWWDSDRVALHFHKSDWEKGYYKIQFKAGRLQIGYLTWTFDTKGSTISFDPLYFGYYEEKASPMEIEYITINNRYGAAYDYRPKVTEEKAELVEVISGKIADIMTVYRQAYYWKDTNDGIVIIPQTDINLNITPTNTNWTYEAKAQFLNTKDNYILRGQTQTTRCFLLFAQDNVFSTLNCTTVSFGLGQQHYDTGVDYSIKLTGNQLTLNGTTTTINVGNELPISLHIGNSIYQSGRYILYNMKITDDNNVVVFNAKVQRKEDAYRLYDTISKKVLYTIDSSTLTTLEDTTEDMPVVFNLEEQTI